MTRQLEPVVFSPEFEDVVREHLPNLLRYATALSGDRELAADVVQEVLLRAHGRWGRIRQHERPDLYLKKMVTNEYLSWRRRWHVRHVFSASPEVLHERAPTSDDVSQRVADHADLQQRLAALPRRQRAVLVLRFYEGLDDPEIAAVLGIAASTVRSTASRALATLRTTGEPS